MDSRSSLGSGRGNALSLAWAFGFNKDLIDGVHSLCTDTREAVFYVAAHTGVIYDCKTRTQRLLQGHCNPICASAVSGNKRWIVTADSGPDSMMVVWDSITGTPVKSIFNPHANGCIALDMTDDAAYVATLSNTENGDPQVLSLWEWGRPGPDQNSIHTSVIEDTDIQTFIRFNPADPRHIITCGAKRTLFWSWLEGGSGMRGYAPKHNRQGMKPAQGVLTGCCFLPGTTQAITTTDQGEIILWDSMDELQKEALFNGKEGKEGLLEHINPEEAALRMLTAHKRAVKVLKLSPCAIRHVSTLFCGGSAGSSNSSTGANVPRGGSVHSGSLASSNQIGAKGATRTYVIIGGDDGAVRFYDLKFRIEGWFEDFDAGPVTSVSFGTTVPQKSRGSTLEAPNFTVGTKQGYILTAGGHLFEELDPAKRRGTVLVQGLKESVTAVHAHPLQPQLVAVCASGDVVAWDYDLKIIAAMRTFDAAKHRPTCIAHHPNGQILAVGFASGSMRFLDSSTLEDAGVSMTVSRPGTQPLAQLRFSADGSWLAATDVDCHVALWKRHVTNESSASEDGDPFQNVLNLEVPESAQTPTTWVYIGRYRSHSNVITGLEFGVLEDGELSLFSVGADKCMVEYDLKRSTVEGGVQLVEDPKYIEEASIPTALLFHPLLKGDFEDRVITASSEYKLKQWNAANKGCRMTSLGPAFGGSINRLLQVTHMYEDNVARPSAYVAYSTPEKVVGLIKLPLNGNPNAAMGLIAHPGAISCVAMSGDGSFLFTAGGSDMTINAWRVDTNALDAQASISEASSDVYIDQLEGGRDGDLYNELVDYFYYSQLRAQGEDCTEERSTSGSATVPLSELPHLMRALGYYPTEQELSNMTNEVKYSEFTVTGEVVTAIDLPGLVKLFVNHRPVFPVGKAMLSDAFQALGCDASSGALSWARLCTMLKGDGKPGSAGGMSDEELRDCLEALTGEANTRLINGKSLLNANDFAEHVLGFEDTSSSGNDTSSILDATNAVMMSTAQAY